MSGEPDRQIDPITLTVVWNSLISIADEMSGALRRTAFSEAVCEGEDFSTGIFDPQARLIAQGNNTPGHLGAMPYVVKNVLDYVPIRRDVEILCASATVSLLSDRHRFPAYGLFGGHPGRRGQTVLIRDGEAVELGSKERRQLQRHDIVSVRLAGAGGYGRPEDRDSALLRRDIARGLVSAAAARNTYGAKDDFED
jgi:N-methylhydantoinase B/oxoprolinase/acetone carboxylase alpha subunit